MSPSAGSALAAVAIKARQTEVREFPLPEIPPMPACCGSRRPGICGSDWGMYLRERPGPRILGHEMIGIVERLGDVRASALGRHGGRPCRARGISAVRALRILPHRRIPLLPRDRRARPRRHPLWLDAADRGAGAVGRLQPVSLHASAHASCIACRRASRRISRRWRCRSATASNGPVSTAAPAPGKTVVVQGPGQQGLGCVIASPSRRRRQDHRHRASRATSGGSRWRASSAPITPSWWTRKICVDGSEAHHRRAHGRHRHRCERRRARARQRGDRAACASAASS